MLSYDSDRMRTVQACDSVPSPRSRWPANRRIASRPSDCPARTDAASSPTASAWAILRPDFRVARRGRSTAALTAAAVNFLRRVVFLRSVKKWRVVSASVRRFIVRRQSVESRRNGERCRGAVAIPPSPADGLTPSGQHARYRPEQHLKLGSSEGTLSKPGPPIQTGLYETASEGQPVRARIVAVAATGRSTEWRFALYRERGKLAARPPGAEPERIGANPSLTSGAAL